MKVKWFIEAPGEYGVFLQSKKRWARDEEKYELGDIEGYGISFAPAPENWDGLKSSLDWDAAFVPVDFVFDSYANFDKNSMADYLGLEYDDDREVAWL